MNWTPYEPTASDPWDAKKAGHLYRRAAFGASQAEISQALKDGPQATLAKLLDGGPRDADFEETSEFTASERSLPAGSSTRQLAAWWLYRMMKSPHPLREKLTLFWHNHFATSHLKVANARLMLGQYRTLFEHALGSFGQMLHAVTLDPAMMIWLDTADSKKGKPNENYARELMELFSLGVGHYSETDIREAAKAFTGFSVNGGKVEFKLRDHDGSAKKVFGKSGRFKAEDVVNLCLDRPECAKFVAKKFYRFYISETAEPAEKLIDELADHYRQAGYDTRTLVAKILSSKLFYSSLAYRQKVKSPVEFAVGIVRSLAGNVGPLPLAEALEGLGQVLFAPPSVKGWDGGTAWLNAQTLLDRQNLALAMTSTEDNRFGRRCDPARNAAADDESLLRDSLQLHLQGDLAEASQAKLAQYLEHSKSTKPPPFWTAQDLQAHRVRVLTHLILSLPEYQLN